MIMREPHAALTPDANTESGLLIRSSLAVHVRIREELPGNERRKHLEVLP